VGLAQLIARLEREADARVAAIDAQASKELAEVVRARERVRSAVREDELTRLRAVRRARLGRELALARSRARAKTLDARRAFVARVMERVARLLPGALEDPSYLESVSRQTTEVLAYAPDRAVILRCAPPLATRLAALCTGDERVSLEADAACDAGVVLVAQDGSLEVDDTLRARLARMAGALAPLFMAEVGG